MTAHQPEPLDIAAIKQAHTPWGTAGRCGSCGYTHPCVTATLCDTLERLHASLVRMERLAWSVSPEEGGPSLELRNKWTREASAALAMVKVRS